MGTDFCSFPFFVVSLQVLLLLRSFQNEKTIAGILLPVVIGCRSTGVAICRLTHRKRWGRAHGSRTVHAFWHGEAWPRLRCASERWLGADARGREFFDENWRRNDMIRFGTFESNYGFHTTQWLDPLDGQVKPFPTARFDKECRIFPIPEGTLNNNTNWKQNAGY